MSLLSVPLGTIFITSGASQIDGIMGTLSPDVLDAAWAATFIDQGGVLHVDYREPAGAPAHCATFSDERFWPVTEEDAVVYLDIDIAVMALMRNVARQLLRAI